MTRWLIALLAVALVVLASYLVLLNPEPVTVRLTPARTVAPPLAAALLAAFGAGGLVVGLAAALRAGARGWRRWHARRDARRDARRADVLARCRELLWAGEYAQARAELARSGPPAADDVPRTALLAESHLREGDPAAARRVLEEGLVRLGLDAHLLDLLAEAAERLHDLRAAADALERARLTRPTSPRLAQRLRDVYVSAGRWAEALAVHDAALLRVRQPEALAAEAELRRGLRYQMALGEADPRRAVGLLLALAREDGGFVPAWVSAGDLLLAADRPVAARRVWERGARRLPAAAVLERLERLNAGEQRPERTTRLYRRLLRRHPEAQGVALLLARHLLLLGALDAAEETLAALPSPLAGHPLAHALWGELHRRRGNQQLAADTFVRAWGAGLGLASPWRCTGCLRTSEAWTGRCPGCGRWGTVQAPVELAGAAGGAGLSA